MAANKELKVNSQPAMQLITSAATGSAASSAATGAAKHAGSAAPNGATPFDELIATVGAFTTAHFTKASAIADASDKAHGSGSAAGVQSVVTADTANAESYEEDSAKISKIT